MMRCTGTTEPNPDFRRDLLRLGLLAPMAGLCVGLVVALFRLTLDAADYLRAKLVSDAALHGPMAGVGVIVLASAMVALAAYLVRRFCPEAAGSGIPRVQKVLAGEAPPAPARVVLVKFIAGALAIAPGLAVGREGPSIQMGASIAYQGGRLFGLGDESSRALLAAGAGAGFAAAFGAPLAGAVFVMEALLKRFEPVAALSTVAAAAVATRVVQLVCGSAPDLMVIAFREPGFVQGALFLSLGVLAGFAGVLYNRSLLAVLSLAERLPVSPIPRAALIGAAVGGAALVAQALVGSGASLTQQALDGATAPHLLPVIMLLRMVLIVLSVAVGTPGGLLVPLLSLGAQLGLLFGLLCLLALPEGLIEPQAFALVGMAALFAAIVRTPLTAVILLSEMSASTTLQLPMAGACFAAMLIPTLLGNAPILDALRERKP
jgi:CIC family chloride channel protein